MRTKTIIAVDVQEWPGLLGSLAKMLGDEGINIDGFSVETKRIQLLTSHAEHAIQIIQAAGHQLEPLRVFEVEVENQPGMLARLSNALAEANVDIVSTFGVGRGERGTIYLSVKDHERALEVLASIPGIRVPHDG